MISALLKSMFKNLIILPLLTTGHRRGARVALLNNDLKLAAH